MSGKTVKEAKIKALVIPTCAVVPPEYSAGVRFPIVGIGTSAGVLEAFIEGKDLLADARTVLNTLVGKGSESQLILLAMAA
ncbi:protein of unknown function [Georgfuchsia toluolica]|uniref:Uncharacterized protein n=1 Tax=Georgfuchsia toluolica TaxID=424218 RepID=A0A916J5S0_9PROT|nr:hypothetical protein [Georgfuchsia toluolica]CAG4882949.1 protein of unknown function [Georgfuchsia toluolica]